jgi:hypothetical protein
VSVINPADPKPAALEGARCPGRDFALKKRMDAPGLVRLSSPHFANHPKRSRGWFDLAHHPPQTISRGAGGWFDLAHHPPQTISRGAGGKPRRASLYIFLKAWSGKSHFPTRPDNTGLFHYKIRYIYYHMKI